MQRNSIQNVALMVTPAFLLIGSLILPAPAHAGFKWVAPPTRQAAPPPVVQSYPETQVITGQPSTAVTGDVQVIMAPSSMAIDVPSPVAPSNVVEGFADNVPLSVALRQILPRDVGYSVAQDVSMGTLVSWKGGKPWRDVLAQMLAPKKLTIKEDAGLVHIIHQGSTGPSFAAAAPPPPAPQPAPVTLSPAPAPYMPAPTPVAYAQQPQTLGFLASTKTTYQGNGGWVAHKGQMLRAVLMDWGRKANVDVSWQAEYDYPFQASVSVMGTFEEAVRKLLSGFQDADPKPVGYLYNNQKAGQRVLVIQTRGNQYAD